MKNKIIMFVLILISGNVFAEEPRQLDVRIYGPQDFADIWLGISTGGYRLLAEKGSDYSFRIFVKNGMSDRAINNFQIIEGDFPFQINNIHPKSFQQIKPMEVVIIWVNTTIPEEAELGTYKFTFESSANEFPQGVFKLESEIKVVKKIKKIYYPIYTLIILGILLILIYRKYRIKKINEEVKR